VKGLLTPAEGGVKVSFTISPVLRNDHIQKARLRVKLRRLWTVFNRIALGVVFSSGEFRCSIRCKLLIEIVAFLYGELYKLSLLKFSGVFFLICKPR